MTEEQIEKERAAFEEWFGAPNGLNRAPEGHYVYATAHNDWKVWLAAKRHAEQSIHPDTMRMNWLYQNGLSKVGKAAIFGANRKIQNIDDLRKAIDNERYRSENPDPL